MNLWNPSGRWEHRLLLPHDIVSVLFGMHIPMRTSLQGFRELVHCAAFNSHRETIPSHLHLMNSCK